jgi:hypothetical protein
MEDDMPATPKLTTGYVDDSIRPFKIRLEKNDFVRVQQAYRSGMGHWQITFLPADASGTLGVDGLRMFVTSVGVAGPTTRTDAAVFVRRISRGPKYQQVVVEIETVPANTSFHFLLVYFDPSDLESTDGIGWIASG